MDMVTEQLLFNSLLEESESPKCTFYSLLFLGTLAAMWKRKGFCCDPEKADDFVSQIFKIVRNIEYRHNDLAIKWEITAARGTYDIGNTHQNDAYMQLIGLHEMIRNRVCRK